MPAGSQTRSTSQGAAERQVDAQAPEPLVLAVLQVGYPVVTSRDGPPHTATSPCRTVSLRTGSPRFSPPKRKVAGSPSEMETLDARRRARLYPDAGSAGYSGTHRIQNPGSRPPLPRRSPELGSSP